MSVPTPPDVRQQRLAFELGGLAMMQTYAERDYFVDEVVSHKDYARYRRRIAEKYGLTEGEVEKYMDLVRREVDSEF